MPTFGEFETYGEPLAVTDERGHVSTVWQARKAGGDQRLFVIKVYAPRQRVAPSGEPEGTLDKDRTLDFLDGIKQIKKAQTEGGRNLAPIHDLGKTAAEAWYVTDHYPRNNLKAWTARRGGVDSAALRQVVSSVITGCLALKQSRSYSHGNLKPSNIFLVGQPRPLKKTPLVLTDAYPAAPAQLAGLEAGDQKQIGELLAQVVEAEDLRKIGELILQLVEGRLLTRNDDYNYPVQHTSIWDILGKDAEFWLKLCNRLVNPQLSLGDVSLESLAAEFRPSQLPRQLALAAAVLVGVGVLGGAVYLGVSRYQAHHRQVETERAQALSECTTELAKAADELNQTNFAGAAEQFRLAQDSADRAKNRSKQTEAAQDLALAELLAKAQDALTANDPGQALPSLESAAPKVKSCDTCARWITTQAIAAGERYLGAAQPDVAERWNKLALVAMPGDPRAAALSARIADAKRAAQDFSGLTNSAAAAEAAGNFTNARVLYQKAAALNANDTEVQAKVLALNPKADEQIKQAAAFLEQQRKDDENFSGLISQARAAEQQGNLTNALAFYKQAARIKANDPEVNGKVNSLPAKIDQQMSALEQQQRQAQRFQSAVESARVAEKAGNLTNALALYHQADQIKGGDKEVAEKLRSLEAKAVDFRGALRSANIAERDGNYTNALSLYQEAAKLSPGDPQVQTALQRLTNKASEQSAQAMEAAQHFETEMAAGAAAEKANNFTNALAHYQEAQKWNRADTRVQNKITALTPLAANQRQAAADRMQQDQQIAQVRLLAQAAEGTNGWALAAHHWQEMRRLAPQDTGAADGMEFASAITNAWSQLDQARARVINAPGQATNLTQLALAALRGAQARANSTARNSALRDVTNQVTQINYAALAALAAASEKQDFQSATNLFNNGEYEQAAALCRKHPDNPDFKAFAPRLAAEQKIYADAKALYDQGDYTYLNALSTNSYATKQGFDELLQNGRKEFAVQTRLIDLKKAADWTTAQSVFANSANAGFVSKPGFASYRQWADEFATAAQKAFLEAQRALDNGQFSLVQQICSTNTDVPKFQALATQATTTSALLNRLQSMTNNWEALDAEWSKVDAALKEKPCFVPLATWHADHNPCRQLQGQLELYEVWLGTRKKSASIIDPNTKRMAEKFSGDIAPDAWRKRVADLRNGLGRCPIEGKDDRLRALDRAINNW